MLKDRKFWTGMLTGAMLAGSVAVLAPLYAAPPAAPSETEYLKAIAGALVQIRDNGKAIQADVAALKSTATSMDKGISELKQGQNINNQPK